MAHEVSFGLWDYVVVGIVLLISSSIGIYYRFTGGKQKTMQEYLLADKNMSITPVAFSLMVSFMSAITLLGVSSENYSYGFQFIVINIGYFIMTPFVAYLYLPIFFKLQTTSIYEYLELRFGKSARLAASVAYTVQMTLYMGIVVYAPALALEAVTGLSVKWSILSIGIVCTFYSTIGGMKAVLITDLFQAILMFIAIFSVIITAWINTESLAEIWRIAEKGGRINLLTIDPDPTIRHSWFSLILGGGVTYLTIYATNQIQIQRYLTLKDLERAQKALWWNWPILCALSVFTSFSGLCIYSKYYNCDPIAAKYINSMDQLMPYYVMDTMGQIPGLSGLFIAGVFSAALSTVSAALNSLATVTFEDYYKPLHNRFFNEDISLNGSSIYTKIIALIYGVICIAVAFTAQFLGGVLQAALTIFGVIGGPILGLFSLGMFTLMANQWGSIVGLVSGMSMSLWIACGPKPPLETLPSSIEGCTEDFIGNFTSAADALTAFTDDRDYLFIYRISYLYNGLIGFLTTYIIGLLCSYIIRKLNKENFRLYFIDFNPDLFIPMLSKEIREKKKLHTEELNLDLYKYSISKENVDLEKNTIENHI